MLQQPWMCCHLADLVSSLCIASEMSDIIISPFTHQCDLPEAWDHDWY